MLALNTILTAAGIVSFCAAAMLAVVALLKTHPLRKGDTGVSLLLALGCVSLLAMLVLQGVRTCRVVPLFNRFDATVVYGIFLTVAALWLLRRHRTQGVMAILAPYVTLLLLAAVPTAGAKSEIMPHQATNAALLPHLAIAFAGYSLFSLASILGCAYLVQDHNLKHRHFGTVFERLPALETLDRLMSRLIGIAFLLLTISLVLGFYLVYETGGTSEWFTDPKIMATMVTWALCALLVHMCANVGRHGKRVALLAVIGLVFVLFSMIGIHQIANSIHDFVQIDSIPD